MTSVKLTGVLAVVTSLVVYGVGTASADVIRQAPGSDFLVVEAEDYEFLKGGREEEGFLIVTEDHPFETAFGSMVLPEDSNASGSAALYDQPGGPAFGNTATWKLQFATPGEYTLYYHFSLFENQNSADYGNENSVFVSADFNESPTVDSWLNMQGFRTPELNGYWEGHFRWQVALDEVDAPATYVVSDRDVGTVLDFSIATRERGATLDLMLFSLDRHLGELENNRFLGKREGEDLDRFLTARGLQAGDADMDLDFDQLDLVQVQIAAKYLTQQPATWGEGDWDGAPGGRPGDPPPGDGVFDQVDIVAALHAALYLEGAYGDPSEFAALSPVPEPSTVILLAVGICGVASMRRRGQSSLRTGRYVP